MSLTLHNADTDTSTKDLNRHEFALEREREREHLSYMIEIFIDFPQAPTIISRSKSQDFKY